MTLNLIVMQSCKKDEETSVTNNNEMPATEMSEKESQILSFIDSYSDYKNGVKSENSPVSIDDAILQWENTLNYCYSFPLTESENTNHDTLYVRMPEADANGMLGSEQLMSTYNSILESVSSHYHAIPEENKILRYVMINRETEEDVKSTDSGRLEVIVTTANERSNTNPSVGRIPWYGVPFSNGDNYPWHIAAEVLTEEILDYDYAHSLYYVPCADCFTYISDRHKEAVYTHKDSDWVFYVDNDSVSSPNLLNYIIAYDEMNKLYASIMTHTHYEGMIINPYGIDWYLETIVSIPPTSSNPPSISHIVTVYNGIREWRHRDEFPIEIPIDNNPPVN